MVARKRIVAPINPHGGIELGPFRRVARVGGKDRIIPLKHISSKMRENHLTPAERAMLRDADIRVHNLRDSIYSLRRKNRISAHQYGVIRDFIRAFMLTPRVEGEKRVFRIPLMEELYGVFPYLKEAFSLQDYLSHPNRPPSRRMTGSK